MGEERALAVRRALARAGDAPKDETADAEALLRARLDEVTALDADVESLSAALAGFGRTYEATLREAFADLAAAERLVRRLQALEDELGTLAEAARAGGAAPARGRRVRKRRSGAARTARAAGEPAPWGDPGHPAGEDAGAGDGEAEGDAPPEVERADVALKRIYRRLARVLHPDLAQGDAERARLSDLMARVNASY